MGNKIIFILILFVLFFEVTGYNPHNVSKEIAKGVLGTPTQEVQQQPSLINNMLPTNMLNNALSNINKMVPQLKTAVPELNGVMPDLNTALPGAGQSLKAVNTYAAMAPTLMILVFVILLFRRVVAIITFFSRR